MNKAELKRQIKECNTGLTYMHRTSTMISELKGKLSALQASLNNNFWRGEQRRKYDQKFSDFKEACQHDATQNSDNIDTTNKRLQELNNQLKAQLAAEASAEKTED